MLFAVPSDAPLPENNRFQSFVEDAVAWGGGVVESWGVVSEGFSSPMMLSQPKAIAMITAAATATT